VRPARPLPTRAPRPAAGPAGPAAATSAIRLPDGRRLGYADYGPADGRPVVYLHGAVGTSLSPDPRMLGVLHGRGIRLIAPSRPGFGTSDPLAGRRVPDWPTDLLALVDALGIGRFGLLAVSAGGPYALACAHQVPASRLHGTVVAGGIAPVVGPGAAAATTPALRLGRVLVRRPAAAHRWGDRLVGILHRHPGLLGAAVGVPASGADRRRLDAGERGQLVAAALAATRRGAGPFLADLRLVLQPWGFALESVRAPVVLVHGAQDATVPVAHAREIERRLPRGRLRLLADEGHYLLRARLADLLDELPA
jgi:pimeloyl-ACP methyl ester carboxylesterase